MVRGKGGIQYVSPLLDDSWVELTSHDWVPGSAATRVMTSIRASEPMTTSALHKRGLSLGSVKISKMSTHTINTSKVASDGPDRRTTFLHNTCVVLGLLSQH